MSLSAQVGTPGPSPGVRRLGGVLASAHHAVLRSARRISQNARLAAETIDLTRRSRGLAGAQKFRDTKSQATLQSWYAENFCTVNGVLVEIAGDLPSGPMVLVGGQLSPVDLVFLTSLVPCVTLMDRGLVHGPVASFLVETLGIRLVDLGSQGSLEHARKALRNGTSVLLLGEPTASQDPAWILRHRDQASSLRVDVYCVDVESQDPTPSWLRAVRTVASRSTSARIRVRRPCLRDE